jgi:hypothetical protein
VPALPCGGAVTPLLRSTYFFLAAFFLVAFFLVDFFALAISISMSG